MRFDAGAEVVRTRSMNICEVCHGRHGAAVNTHHRQARGMGGVTGAGLAVNRPSALIRVCLVCHDWIEHNRTAAAELGLLVPRPGDPAATPAWLHTLYGRAWTLLSDEGDYLLDYLRPAPVSARS